MRNRENVKDMESNWLLWREGNNGQDTETGRRVTDAKALPSCDLLRFSRRSRHCSRPTQRNDQKSKFKIQFLLSVYRFRTIIKSKNPKSKKASLARDCLCY